MKNNATPIQSAIRTMIPPLLLCSASFIFCMHWFLLMADTLATGVTSEVIPAPILSSIIAYYTIVFGDMTWLIKIFILLFLLTMTIQLFIHEVPKVFSWTIFIIHAPLIFNGVFRIIPMVDELILNTQTPEVQSQVVRAVHNAHLISAYSAALVILLQLMVLVRLGQRAE